MMWPVNSADAVHLEPGQSGDCGKEAVWDQTRIRS